MRKTDPCPACDVNMFKDVKDRQDHVEKCAAELRTEHLDLVKQAKEMDQHLIYVCQIAERLGPKAKSAHREEALQLLDGTVAEARQLLTKRRACTCGVNTFIKALHGVGCPKRY